MVAWTVQPFLLKLCYFILFVFLKPWKKSETSTGTGQTIGNWISRAGKSARPRNKNTDWKCSQSWTATKPKMDYHTDVFKECSQMQQINPNPNWKTAFQMQPKHRHGLECENMLQHRILFWSNFLKVSKIPLKCFPNLVCQISDFSQLCGLVGCCFI